MTDEDIDELEKELEAAIEEKIESRTILLTGEITHQSYAQTASAILDLNKEDGPIRLVLNSGGGEVSQGFAIYELIKNSRNPVSVYGMGQVMSIAAAIIQGGAERFMSPYCRFMIHNGTVTYEKPVEISKFKSQLKDMHLDSEIYYDILCERSKLPRSKVKSMCDAERYLTAQQCLELGFIDGIRII